MRDAAAIVGIAQSEYTKWGGLTRCTEYQLALETIVKAVEDAGLSVDDVDGFASFSNDRNEAAFVATDLGVPELRYAGMTWIVGGGGACAAVAEAAMAIATGMASCVVVYRSIAMGQFQRFGRVSSLHRDHRLRMAPFKFLQHFGQNVLANARARAHAQSPAAPLIQLVNGFTSSRHVTQNFLGVLQ